MNDKKYDSLKVFDEYINQLEQLVDENFPQMGSSFENDLTLFCIENNYLFAIDENKNQISENMERVLQKKYIEGFTVQKGKNNYELRRCSGPHSEFQNYFFKKVINSN